jgi:hypothetical protein
MTASLQRIVVKGRDYSLTYRNPQPNLKTPLVYYLRYFDKFLPLSYNSSVHLLNNPLWSLLQD